MCRTRINILTITNLALRAYEASEWKINCPYCIPVYLFISHSNLGMPFIKTDTWALHLQNFILICNAMRYHSKTYNSLIRFPSLPGDVMHWYRRPLLAPTRTNVTSAPTTRQNETCMRFMSGSNLFRNIFIGQGWVDFDKCFFFSSFWVFSFLIRQMPEKMLLYLSSR